MVIAGRGVARGDPNLILDDDYENIPTPLVINKNGKSVYWDVADYPVPKDVDLDSLRMRIESILHDLGCPEVSIVAYVYKNRFSDEQERKFKDAKIFVDFLPEGDDIARMTWMLVDIICLPVVFPKPNVIVLSKHMEKEAVDCFQSMYFNGVGVLLSKTEPGWLVPDDSSAFELTRLFEKHLDCEKPQREDTLANSVDHPLDEETNVSS
ncbi:uncharacterized protein LOC106350393 [Brassica napus]|uniref:uncharacterized protein LOC106350393 n=1 Tax=Brassica napus TaxID=3708 RepID=UPI002078F1CA|nr:uncharacterized protein LOC106350393 [Brassica napus]